MGTEEEKRFEEELSHFPSSFQLKLNTLTKPKLKILREKLQSKIQCGFIILDEEIQVYNLVSYLSFVTGDVEDAFAYNEKALKKRGNNIIALANRAWFNRHNGKFYQAQKDLERLQASSENKLDTDGIDAKKLAEGELALSYGRCGPTFCEMALNLYKSLLQDDLPNPDVLILWKYDYGVCLRRALHIFNSALFPDRDFSDTMKQACDVFCDVIETSHIKTYRARAWCELGQLAYSINKFPETYVLEVGAYISVHEGEETSLDYFNRAMELGGDDFDVIEACARYYRYFDKLEETVELYRKALKLRETSLAYHHLALALKSLEKIRVQGSWTKTTNLTPHQEEWLNAKLILKSGRNAARIVLNQAMEDVLFNLDEAIRIDSTNLRAAYDKAYTLRQLDKPEEARMLLCKIASSIDIGELKVSCLEQAGYCCLDIAKSEIDTKRKEYEHDAICWFQKATEVAAILATKVNYSSTEVRALLPTVQGLLIDPAKLETHNCQIKRLKILLKRHHQYFPITEEILFDEILDITTLLEKYITVGRKNDAAFLAILKRFVSEKDDDEYLTDMNIILDAASEALASGDKDDARIRYQIWYELLKMRIHEQTKTKTFDMFVMTDEESENLEPMAMVSSWFKEYCGFNVANSDENCAIGKQQVPSLMQFIESSVSVVVVSKREEIDDGLKFVINAVPKLQANVKPKLVILKENSIKLPLEWSNIDSIPLPPDTEGENMDYISSWISGLLQTLLI